MLTGYPHPDVCDVKGCDKEYEKRGPNHKYCETCANKKTRRKKRRYERNQRRRRALAATYERMGIDPDSEGGEGYDVVPMNGEWPDNCHFGLLANADMLQYALWPTGIRLLEVASGRMLEVRGQQRPVSMAIEEEFEWQWMVEVKDEQDV